MDLLSEVNIKYNIVVVILSVRVILTLVKAGMKSTSENYVNFVFTVQLSESGMNCQQ